MQGQERERIEEPSGDANSSLRMFVMKLNLFIFPIFTFPFATPFTFECVSEGGLCCSDFLLLNSAGIQKDNDVHFVVYSLLASDMNNSIVVITEWRI